MNNINATYIREFNPCNSGILHFEKEYPNWSGTIKDLLTLENISYIDKIWLVCKIVNIEILKQWSVDCAESVLHIYEEQYPNDSRIRDCISITKKYLLNECSLEELNAARSAAMSAVMSAARSAAMSAESAWSAAAARSAVESAWSAAAARSAVESAAAESAAAESAAARSAAKKEQEYINLSLLIALL